LGLNTSDAFSLDEQITDCALEQSQTGLSFNDFSHSGAIKRTVCLCASRAHGGALAGVESAEVDASSICSLCHGTTERVDFTNYMPLANSTDGGITGHCTDRFNTVGDQHCALPQASAGERCLGTGVTAANDDDIELLGMLH